ncbi:MAG TPA: ECF transporter S component [Caldisericia bacterium]|nr:ECF transporter S component [Caldisericia bacterium]HPF48197.1 ECF transporter S component [Caldisericia bacterium]HPI83867.1 ECF transporter S component [Caldisericia bacterium]HPQ92650.1 ECF transporter S component [Caldisericia bacterium]HRV74252.1 ECF transporter S component [Caldisericia bacterium]
MFKLTTKQITLAGVLGALMIIMGLIGTGLIPVPNLAGAMTLYHIVIIIGAIVCGPMVGFLLGVIFAAVVTFQFGAVFPWYVLIPGRLLIGPFAWLTYTGIKRAFDRRQGMRSGVALTIGGIIIAAILVVGYFTFKTSVPVIDTAGLSKTVTDGIASLNGIISTLSTNGLMFVIALAIGFGVSGIFTLLRLKAESTATTVSAIVGTLTNTIVTLGLGVVFPTILGETMGVRLKVATGIFATNGLLEIIIAVVISLAVVPPLLERFGQAGEQTTEVFER